MAGNTTGSASSRSVGYISNAVNGNPDTTVNVYVNANDPTYSKIGSYEVAPVDLNTSLGITGPVKKGFNYAGNQQDATGKFAFDTLSPALASNSTKVQVVGGSINVPLDSTTLAQAGYASAVSGSKWSFSIRPPVGSDSIIDRPVPRPPVTLDDYEFNLPPHRWSRPRIAASDPANVPANFKKRLSSNDRYRRGRIWYKKADTSLSVIDAKNNVTKIDDSNRRFGFQFLWNPTSFGTSVSVQMDVTPQVQDRFLGTVGAFPATESISFNVRVDRINDFACANSRFGRPLDIGSQLNDIGVNQFVFKDQIGDLAQFYTGQDGWSLSPLGVTGTSLSVERKLMELFERGTLADIEYLYRAINGVGPNGGTTDKDKWKNGRGIATADIGFLMPTLLHIDIGPLSYIGYINNLSITHNIFTQDMIPIQSDVQMSFQLLATAGLTSQTANTNPLDNYHGPRGNDFKPLIGGALP